MKKLLALCFFPAFTPPLSGGELRLLNIYKRLCERFDVSLVSWTYPNGRFEIVQHGPNFREYRIPKDDAFDHAHDSCCKAGIYGELSGAVCAMAGRANTQYHAVVAELVGTVDAVIHESPYTLPYDRTLFTDGKPRIYNSYNIEADIVPSVATGEHVAYAIDLVSQLERSLVANSRLVFATSPEELLKFRLYYGASKEKLHLAPNGFSPEEFDFNRQEYSQTGRYALFVGSQHPPNVDGARFIVEELAPRFPQQRFVVAGRVCEAIASAPENVHLAGEFTAHEKIRLFQGASVFVNPIFSGAGTSLKMVEAMAAGLPIVTTHVGARGLGLEHNVHALFARPEEFAEAFSGLARSTLLRRRLAEAARQAAHDRFSWSSIARGMADTIDHALAGRNHVPCPRRPMTLVVNDYSVSRAVSGGASRIRNLLGQVAATRDVCLLCLHDNPAVEVEELSPGFTEIRIPKDVAHKTFEHALNSSNWTVSVSDIAAALFCLDNQTLKRVFLHIVDNSDTLVFSHPYMAPLLELVGKCRPVVYEAHNVESNMKPGILSPHSDKDILCAFVQTLESYILDNSDALVCATESDRSVLTHGRRDIPSHVVFNGCDALKKQEANDAVAARSLRDLSAAVRVVFIGSGHAPNRDAALFLCTELLPCLPNMHLWIVGSVGESLEAFASVPGVRLFGVVTDRQKHELLLQADIAINSVVSGGGSNLKIAEYLGYALPTLSTEEGVRGFAVQDDVHVLVRPKERFAQAIGELVADKDKRTRLAQAGYEYAAAHLDWPALGRRYAQALDRLSLPRPAGAAPRLLVVTYRYTEPCLGGAEEFLARLMQRYVELYGACVDLVAADVERIGSLHHFGSLCEAGGRQPESLFAACFHRVDLFAPKPLDEAAALAASRELWSVCMQEQLALGGQAAEAMDQTCLLGGWYYAEWNQGAAQCWSSPCAEIHVALGVCGLRLGVWHPGAAGVEIQIDDDTPTRLSVREDQTLELAVPPESTHRVRMRVFAASPGKDDPRQLGVLLKKLETLQSRQGVWRNVSLELNFTLAWRQADPAGWVQALKAVTLARPAAAEEAFHRVRGPRSPELVEHVRAVAPGYDAVLVQGVPFSNTVDVLRALRGCGVPTMVLPHYHVDDAFYHWNSYYDAFAQADAVLSSSQWLSDHFFSGLGARAPVIGGGGADPCEYTSRGRHLQEFRAFYGDEKPYFLVLGRKTGSKGYQAAVEAHQELLRKTGWDVGLVLIGPDEDGRPVQGDNVRSYGRLKRELVLGALAGCAALVSMSMSESFGIVLVEAWMSGRPVIANRGCLALSELVEAGKDGLLVGAVDELAQAMETLLSDPALADAMGSAGHKKSMERYTWSAMAHRFHGVVAELVHGPARAPRTSEAPAARRP